MHIDDQVRDSVLNNIAAQMWMEVCNQVMCELSCGIQVVTQAWDIHTQLLQKVRDQVCDHEH